MCLDELPPRYQRAEFSFRCVILENRQFQCTAPQQDTGSGSVANHDQIAGTPIDDPQ
jgi:hypothetical protein